MYPTLNEKNLTHENILHKKLDIEENISSSEKKINKTKQFEIKKDIFSLKNNDKDNEQIKPDFFEKIKDNKISNNLFDEENLEDLPEDYDENFNDLYSILSSPLLLGLLHITETVGYSFPLLSSVYTESSVDIFSNPTCSQ